MTSGLGEIIARLHQIAENELPFGGAHNIADELEQAAQSIGAVVSGTGHEQLAGEVQSVAEQLKLYNMDMLSKVKELVEQTAIRLSG